MGNCLAYDYFYGGESEQFSYYRIPRVLITGTQFRQLSTDAKLLYGLLLDRMGLSARNGWYDGQGRVFIYYPLEEIESALNCSHSKAVRLFAELDSEKGIGLIERVKQGQGRPAIIYVKRFTTREVPEVQMEPPTRSEVSKEEVLKFQNDTSRSSKMGSQDVSKSDASYIKYNYPDNSYLNPSIHLLPEGEMDRCDCKAQIKKQIGYERLKAMYDMEDVDGIVELLADILCSGKATIRISGEQLPLATVKERFLKLDQSHMEYVFDSLKKNTTSIRNIRGYLLTALYNAPLTIGPYYQAAVQHDLYGQ